MKNIKKIIPIIIILLTIGFAAVNYTLSLDGDANLTGDLEDFKVYFSRVLINGVEDNSIVTSSTSLDFTKKLDKIGEEYIITYDVTNGSKYFNASISISCTQGDEYLSVTNTFDTSNLVSLETRTGTLALKRLKSLASNDSSFKNITCTINAQPIERETLGEGTITNPVNPYYIGKEISIGEEKFNIISEQKDTITMLAKYNISDTEPYEQTDVQVGAMFSNNYGWDFTPRPKEIDIQTWGGDTKTILNNYVSYLKSQYGDDITGDLITVAQLGVLGCTVPADYYQSINPWNCNNTKHKDWLANGQDWWTRSAYGSDAIWLVYHDGVLDIISYDFAYGVRPTITISKETLKKDYITFTIDGITYRAFKDMTWSEWLNSTFSLYADITNNSEYLANQPGTGAPRMTLNSTDVLVTDKIVDNGEYSF